MLVNKDKTSKTRILSVLIACENCGIQLVPNIGMELLMNLFYDYGHNQTGAAVLLQCPNCLSTHQFEDYDI